MEIIIASIIGFLVLTAVCWAAIFKPFKMLRKEQRHIENMQNELDRIKQFPIVNPDPVLNIALNGEVLFANPAALEKYPDIREKGFSHPIFAKLEDFIEKVEQKKDSEDLVLNRELSFGGIFYEQKVASIEWHGERTLVSYCHDVTTHKIFEKQLQITKDAADVANRAKGDFLANISHELRTPMNGIIGLSELLMGMGLSEEQVELAAAVNSSSRNLLFLLNDILDLSKIEAGELSLEHIPFDVHRTIYQTVDLLKPIASRKSVIIDSVVSPIVYERIKGDPARLQQILNNLISNAIKFTEDGYVRIDITSGRDNFDQPELHIRVEDTGIGIPEDKRETIFQKFTQADVSTARKYGGTGLGLSITKELVQMMGGEISFDSVEGKGTTFFVKLPIEVAGAAELSSKGSTNDISINLNSSILVVDDHPINLLFMRKVLKKLEFEDVDEASCGREAIELTSQKKYDIIFMDCQMPDIDGFEASTSIRESEENIGDIKIIAVTADAMKGAKEKCLDAGMNDYISKPVDIEKLKDVLSIWIPEAEKSKKKKKTAAPIKKEIKAPTSPMQETNDIDQDFGSMIINWERIRMFTDGDPEEEQILINLFITHADEALELIKNQTSDEEKGEWKNTAHKLMGSAANLGAQVLSDVCYRAEQSFEESEIAKKEILAAIQSAYQDFHEALNNALLRQT